MSGERLRIAILGTRGIPARYGGFETFAERLALGLVARGMDVTVYAEGLSGDPSGDRDYHGICVRPVVPWRVGRASVLAYDVQCLWDARRDFDVVYMLGYGAAWACWLPRLSGARVWINIDGLEWARSKWGPWVRRYLRLMEGVAARVAHRVVADAKAIQTHYIQSYPLGAPSTFIPYGAEIPQTVSPDSALVALGLVPRAFLLVIARMEPENHVLEIIDGHALWGGAWPLVIVGDAHANTPFCARLRAQGGERVRFLGAVYEPDLLAALRTRCRAYLHGHSVGGTNPSLIEAMACGCQVIAHDNVFNREVLGPQGEFFGSVSELAAALHALEGESHHDRQAKRRDAVDRVRAQYTWEGVIDSYVSVIEQDLPGRMARRIA